MDDTRWGIVGTGSIASQFASDMAHVPNGKLVAVASRTQSTAIDFATQHEIPVGHGSYQQLMEDPGVDAVYVATPHTLHVDNSVAALQCNKAVLCEKPMAPTPAGCESIINAARKADTYLMEGMWTYFLPAIRKAREWVNEGRIGEIKTIKADFGFPQTYDPLSRAYNPDLAGGVLLDMGIYPIALVCLFMDEDPHAIDVTAKCAPTGVDDELSVVYKYRDVKATLAASFRSRLSNQAIISGRKGCIKIPDFWRAQECHLYRGDERVDSYSDSRQNIGLNYEAIAIGEDLAAGRRQSAVVPWSATRRFQSHMARIFDQV